MSSIRYAPASLTPLELLELRSKFRVFVAVAHRYSTYCGSAGASAIHIARLPLYLRVRVPAGANGPQDGTNGLDNRPRSVRFARGGRGFEARDPEPKPVPDGLGLAVSVALATYACSGIEITPNCCIISRVSVMRQCSRILPSDTRSTEMLLMLSRWPVGGTPKSSPSCVPSRV
jgi:hypothetical protein